MTVQSTDAYSIESTAQNKVERVWQFIFLQKYCATVLATLQIKFFHFLPWHFFSFEIIEQHFGNGDHPSESFFS